MKKWLTVWQWEKGSTLGLMLLVMLSDPNKCLLYTSQTSRWDDIPYSMTSTKLFSIRETKQGAVRTCPSPMSSHLISNWKL